LRKLEDLVLDLKLKGRWAGFEIKMILFLETFL
jgi:hypothetical protein